MYMGLVAAQPPARSQKTATALTTFQCTVLVRSCRVCLLELGWRSLRLDVASRSVYETGCAGLGASYIAMIKCNAACEHMLPGDAAQL